MLRRLHSEGRRTLPERVPTSHLSPTDRKLIFGQQKPDRRLYEIATLAALRERYPATSVVVLSASQDRDDIARGAADLGVELDEHIDFCIAALHVALLAANAEDRTARRAGLEGPPRRSADCSAKAAWAACTQRAIA